MTENCHFEMFIRLIVDAWFTKECWNLIQITGYFNNGEKRKFNKVFSLWVAKRNIKKWMTIWQFPSKIYQKCLSF